MPQPSITSFFSATVKSNENDPKSGPKKVNSALQNVSENLEEHSPVKLETKRKRVRQISSSESEGENDRAAKGNGVAKDMQQNNGAAEMHSEELPKKDNFASGKSTPKLNGKKKNTNTPDEDIKEESSKIKNTPKTSGRKRKTKSPAENEETTDVKGTPKPTAKKQKTKPNKEESEEGKDTPKSGTKRKAKNPIETEQESSTKKKSSKTKAKIQKAENSELEDKIADDEVTPKSTTKKQNKKSEKGKNTPKSETKCKATSPRETKAKKLVAENSELVSKEDKIADDTPEKKAQKMQSPEDESEEEKLEEKTNKKLGGAGLGNWLKKSVKLESKEVNPETSAGKKITKQIKSNDDGMNYDPSKSKYDPVNDACWKEGEKVPYIALAKTLEVIENISARLKMIEYLRNFFRSVIMQTPDELLPCVYLCLNKVGPAYEGLELGIGEMLLYKTIAQATGRSVDKVKSDVASKGDVGIVAESCRASQQTMFAPPKLTVTTVFKNLKEIAQMSGHSVMSKKIDKISVMLVACRGSEARYLMRSLEGKLRVGLAEQSVLVALSHAAAMCTGSQLSKQELDEHTVALKTAYCECPTYDVIIPVLLKDGIKGVADQCKLTPGVPLKPMLANPTKGVQEVLERFENVNFTCEYKYDGERAQIHVLESGNICIYSRNQENMTTKYPDIIQRLPQVLGPNVKSCILDSEAVAWDRETKKIRPFQVLSTRKKKNVQESEIKVQVCVFAFDLLYLNGEPLVRKPFIERRKILNESFKQVEGEFMFAKSIDSNQTEEIAEFLEESVKGDCEGLMVKALDVDANYEIAKRSRNWLKLKKDYLEGVGDTLDVVVIAGYHGKGKRSGIYGGFLLACYDDENEEFQTICKIGTGFKDDDFEKHATFFKEHVISEPRSYYRYDSSLQPDVWFEPVQVWEIKCADLTISPVHKAAVGIVDPVSGISLRFPRFLRIRDDKSPEDATSSSQVADLYKNQEQIKNQNKSTTKDENEDFY